MSLLVSWMHYIKDNIFIFVHAKITGVVLVLSNIQTLNLNLKKTIVVSTHLDSSVKTDHLSCIMRIKNII